MSCKLENFEDFSAESRYSSSDLSELEPVRQMILCDSLHMLDWSRYAAHNRGMKHFVLG